MNNLEIYSLNDLYHIDSKLFLSVQNIFTNKEFPCLFAINSYYKKQMFFCDLRKYHGKKLYNNIYLKLSEFKNFISNENTKKKSFFTILFIVDNILIDINDEFKKRQSIKKFIFDILINLKKIDNTNITEEDLLKADFEFSLDNFIWFPVFMANNHVSLIRETEISIIAFQPKITFDCLKKIPNHFYEKTRTATHQRINKIYQGKLPYFLSNKSTGINAIQYIGFDPFEITS